MKENVGKGAALEFRECALEGLRAWPVEVDGRCEGIESKGELAGMPGGIDIEVMVGMNCRCSPNGIFLSSRRNGRVLTRFPAPWGLVNDRLRR